ncbi:hypothetical protein ACE939_06105 [Aquimarina sp. W85]|uniref:hypothetical protein n=1 Tax=Aquimarina rhodophyticola TaxID=3342246 RepID=UPI00367084A3
MQKDDLETFFEKTRNDLDIHEPSNTHFEKFHNRLLAIDDGFIIKKSPKLKWSKWLSIAATVALLLGSSLFILNNYQLSNRELSSVSDEMYITQNFFATSITQKLKEIKNSATKNDIHLVNDATKQLEKLEIAYHKLKEDLVISNNDTRVISAMIENFQQRAILLEKVLETIQKNKVNKNYSNENNIL